MTEPLLMDKSHIEPVKTFLDEQYLKYCHSAFIEDDPIQIPHQFSQQQNVEIAGLLAATFAWGQRKTIIAKSNDLIRRLDGNPYDFVLNHSEADLKQLSGFRHRTFSDRDALVFIEALAVIYRKYPTMDGFLAAHHVADPLGAIRVLRSIFAAVAAHHGTPQSLRHFANVDAGSAAKRVNMFFRWMVRSDREGVDFGLWKSLTPSQLLIPLDLHVGNVSRELGILHRRQNDLKAVVELTAFLKLLDPADPVKYDFALFSLGVNA